MALSAPKTRILTGAGYMFRAAIGSLLPGQTSAAVTNKALASNEVTLTTSAAHGLAVGKDIIVDIDDPVFDGRYTTITGTTASTIKYARTAADVTSASATGTAISWDAGGTVSGGVFTDSWPAAWKMWGVTREGSTWTWTPQTGNVEVAEELLPLRIITTGVESTVEFEVVEFTASNLAAALNGGSTRTVSGSGASLLTELVPPTLGAETRTMLGWESEDATERAVWMQTFQSGDLSIAHQKGTDNAGLSMSFGLEQPAVGVPFRRFYAGSTPVGS